MERKSVYGLSRTRDKAGNITGRHIRDHVNCIHTAVGGGYETMQVLVLEVYEDTTASARLLQGRASRMDARP